MATDIVSLFDSFIQQGKALNASDLHIEPKENEYTIRFRIDGMLQEIAIMSKQTCTNLINHIKLSGHCDIAESRKPQDGRIGKSIRFSTMPTVRGEKCVLRFLTKNNQVQPLSTLGLLPNQENCLQKAIHKPQGLILITGPTGSGKTTTLYSLLSEINTDERCICTIEDPVECMLDKINQIQVQSKLNLGFSEILRSLLRQDPDVIMVGEIRDTETATLALKAAQTGHLVLATLHTNSAIESIIRLQHLGCDKLSIASSLTVMIGQRLVRIKKECHYEGRRAIYEVIPMTRDINSAILKGHIPVIQNETSLKAHGQMLVDKGITTQSEIHRVCL